ncbi:triacylglycerol lipase [Lacisediminimonas sp.]|uniref:esterase/lipase family protein n=1 Tax=Lacisediminimonas sp. TaxID=3060582 RepID=UPI002725A4F5|nr:hypothetical protein [Lacisediminimonas sp.]MDO8299798.1 hypothetical protein [Lacisediminimonas sp.]
MPDKNARFHPIIYVRGYAMSAQEIDSTTADPFCGFNLGSTVYRAVPERDRPPRKYIFESPTVRLLSDFGYQDVYEDGYDIMDDEWKDNPDNRLARRSIIIYRYYDEASRLLGSGQRPPIEQFARELGELIIRIRDLACANQANKLTPDTFRCYLVAHSMGGLVCRALLQNPAHDPHDAHRYVDKFFTYATPHNGIDVAGINVPGWLAHNDINNFNRDNMAAYLGLGRAFEQTRRVDWIPEQRLPSARVFCMVGTNRLDYEAAFGLSRNFVGQGSDGLVRIENATLSGWTDAGGKGAPCAKAFAYRAHSGYFGIVNSEEAYQNLTRFLFGDVRVDMWVDIEQIRLPEAVEQQASSGHAVNALYQFELLAAPRGKLWYLTRRTSEEDSVACLSHKEWMTQRDQHRSLYVSTVFLANSARVNPRRRSLAYSMTLGVRVPDYEIDRKLWINEHYEGGYLFRDALVIEMVPPKDASEAWRVKYAWQGAGVGPADTVVDATVLDSGSIEIRIAFGSDAKPGIQGNVRLIASGWNVGADD